MEVLVKAKIDNEEEETLFEGKGTFDQKNNVLRYTDNFATLSIFVNEDIMLRETKDSLLSYKFKEKEKTNFEVLLKDLNQQGYVKMETYKIEKQKNSYKVVYQIEGNDFKHTYYVEWRIL